MYKYDLHIHTDEVSPCGSVPAKEMVHVYRQQGYQGMVITDHYRKIFFRNSQGITWEEKVEDFLRGYKLAKEEADKLDMDVMLGLEIAFMENKEKANDYLIYGITEDLIKKTPDLLDRGIEGVKVFCDENNCLLYQAHPMRGYCKLVDLDLLHGVEVYNGNPRHNSNNEQVLAIAKEHDLGMVAGSDYHDPGDENGGGILTTKRIRNNDDLLDLLRARDYEIYRGK